MRHSWNKFRQSMKTQTGSSFDTRGRKPQNKTGNVCEIVRGCVGQMRGDLTSVYS